MTVAGLRERAPEERPKVRSRYDGVSTHFKQPLRQQNFLRFFISMLSPIVALIGLSGA